MQGDTKNGFDSMVYRKVTRAFRTTFCANRMRRIAGG
jgi:hypothetical protein